MSLQLIAWLAQRAAVKTAESYILPPRKTTPRSRTFKPGEQDDGESGGPSQLPHRYGVTRRPRGDKGERA